MPWPNELFVADPAPIITSTERLARKRGGEAMGRCPTEADAVAAAEVVGGSVESTGSKPARRIRIQGRWRAVPGRADVVGRFRILTDSPYQLNLK